MLDQVASLGTAWDANRLGKPTPTADGAAATLTTLACSRLQLFGGLCISYWQLKSHSYLS